MNVNELISSLSKIEDKERSITICVETSWGEIGSNYAHYPIAECGMNADMLSITAKIKDENMQRVLSGELKRYNFK